MKSLTHPFLQGWLEKRKHKNSGILSNTTKRWFTIENIGPDQEIALCYYQNPSSPSISGWIFLSDVTNFEERTEDGRTWIVIEHPRRTFWLGSLDIHQHHLWINNLNHYCRRKSNIQETLIEPQRNIEKQGIETKHRLEPADARGEFETLSNRRQSLQMSSERDFDSELEFIRSINGAKTKVKDEQGETDSISAPSIQHDYDLGYHLRAEKETSIYDELNTGIDGKASIEDSDFKIPQIVHREVHAENPSPHRFENTAYKSENSIRTQRDYDYSDETINSRLSRAILMDTNNATTYNSEETNATLATYSVQVDSSEDEEKDDNSDGSISDTVKEKPSTPNDCADSHKEELKELSPKLASITDDKVNISLDDDCSFLPDHDFVTADWDEDSVC